MVPVHRMACGEKGESTGSLVRQDLVTKPARMQVDKEARTLAAHSFFPVAAGAVLTIAWTPDSQQVIAACETDDGSPRSSDVCIKVCRIGNNAHGTDVRILDVEMQAGPLRAMCCSTDGKYLYRIDTDQNLVRPQTRIAS